MGLKGRSIGLCLALVLGTALALSTALLWLDRTDSTRAMRARAVVHARSLSRSAEPGVLLNDSRTLTNVVAAAFEDGAVCQAHILDAAGDVLARRGRGVCEKSDPLDQPELVTAWFADGQTDRNGVFTHEIGSHLVTVVPIWPEQREIDLDLIEDEEPTDSYEGPIGYVAISYSFKSLNEEFVNSVLSVLFVAGIVIVLGITATIISVGKLLGPLRNLVDTANAIAHGDRSKRAREDGMGEIGEMGRSFNYMAQRLQESYDSIESVVEQRTAELIKANRAKDDFLANMSHEIRTPMTAIVGFAETLHDAKITVSERAEVIQTIRRNGDHLLHLINDILDLSKIEAGKMELEWLPCSLVKIIEEVHSLMRARAENKNLTFKIEYLTKIPDMIEIDSTRLRQILINLVGNAIKFTDHGSVCLRVRMDRINDDQPPVYGLSFEVVDTGIGMSPTQAENAFETFTQADETMSRRYGGTGLGLAISRHLAKMLGGEITFTTKPNQGSTFTLSVVLRSIAALNLIDPLDHQVQSLAKDVEECPIVNNVELNCRILLVEDGPDNQRLISFVLRRAGAEVLVAENGQLALEMVANTDSGRSFDVILMDMQMPVLDGYSATSELRAQGYQRPIIALTAHAMSSDREKCLDAGCDDYLSKPIDRSELIRVVARYAEDSLKTTS